MLPRWTPLSLANLPGADLSRRPRFTSPYHHRLDWETWIHTTASMEADATRWLASGKAESPRLRLPSIVDNLVRGVLAGDVDAIGLLGTPLEALVVDGAFPTAIRAEFYLYDFTDWGTLKTDGTWFSRERMTSPKVYRPTPQTTPVPPRIPTRERHDARLIAALGAASVVSRATRRRVPSISDATTLLACALAFAFATAANFGAVLSTVAAALSLLVLFFGAAVVAVPSGLRPKAPTRPGALQILAEVAALVALARVATRAIAVQDLLATATAGARRAPPGLSPLQDL